MITRYRTCSNCGENAPHHIKAEECVTCVDERIECNNLITEIQQALVDRFNKVMTVGGGVSRGGHYKAPYKQYNFSKNQLL